MLDKLPAYGVSGNGKAWFTDYLFHRKMRVSYQTTLSTPIPIHCGVPQGSILGPLLFLLHFKELSSLLKSCKMIMYVDNTVLYYSYKDMKEIGKVLSQDLCTVSKWLQENELKLNLKKGKTEVMLFGTKKRLNQQEREIGINYQSQPINTTNNYKYLVVHLDPSLNMQALIVPSAYCTNNYIMFPYKLLSSTIPKILNTCPRVSCLQTDQQRHTISQQNLPKKNMCLNCV